jgi:hypothetical protein
MEKVFVVKKVAEKLWAAENGIDATLEQTSELMAGIVEARKDLAISHIVVDPAIGKVAEAMSALAAARHAMIEAHHALNEAKLRIGVRTKIAATDPNMIVVPSLVEDHRVPDMISDRAVG